MTARRIHITGASGSGTTTLGRALAERHGHAFFDVDSYFWEPTQPPFQTIRPKPERLNLLLPDLARVDAFVLAGSICGWDATLEDSFDLIIFLQVPAEVRLARLCAREIQRYGKVNEEFLAWAARYDNGDFTVRSRALHERWLAQRRCTTIRLEGDLTNEERLDAITERRSLPNY